MQYSFIRATTLCLILFLGCSTLFSQIPPGYYATATGLSGNVLKDALNNIIDGHVEFPYTSSGTDVWDILKETDKDTLNPNHVSLFYTGWTLDAAAEYNGGNGWNREHVWAKSHGDFGTGKGPGTDVHALRPTDISVNGARANRWFDEGDQQYVDGDGPTDCYIGTSSYVWEPRDKVKGDVARMIFYMATRYEGENGEVDLEMVDYIPSNSNTSAPIHAKLSTLIQWHIDDPVDDWERNRNDIIYYNYQGNRNPFIDHPEFVAEIWQSTAALIENSSDQPLELIKVVDLMGRTCDVHAGEVLLYIFSDGSIVKKFKAN
jgi:endonuclease I